MEKLIKRYWGIMIFYLVIIGGVLVVNHRLSLINNHNIRTTYFTK